MKRQWGLWTAAIAFAVCLASLPSPSAATVYFWVDEDGVKHFSNTPPPEGAEVLFRQTEIPYDREADQKRHASEALARQARELEAARERLAEAEAALDDTLQRARDAEQRADALAVAAAARAQDEDEYVYRAVYPYWGYRAPLYRAKRRWHHPGQRGARPAPHALGLNQPSAGHARPRGGTLGPGHSAPSSRPATWGDQGGGLKLYIRF
jgi:hypothetical protein